MVALSIGGFSRILVDCSVDFSVDFSVRISVGWLSVGFDLSVGLDRVDTAISLFLKIRCSVDDFIISIVDCHRGLVAFKLDLQIGIGIHW
jgi:hypothetical protein